MKIYRFVTIAAAAVATPALVWAHRGHGDHDDHGDHGHVQGGRRVVYVFDGDYAGGIDGTIQTIWDSNDDASTQVTIEADLRFKRVDQNALMKADGNCTGLPTQYQWHIHTLWNQSSDNVHSASYAQCARSITGNHFDPTKACGPASEFVDTPDCAGKPKNYKCTPAGYAQNVASCEVGDLSGKLGPLTPDKDGKLQVTFTDAHYASWSQQQPTWNIVIHAVCGSASPRVACALGMQVDQDSAPQKRLRGSSTADSVEIKSTSATAKHHHHHHGTHRPPRPHHGNGGKPSKDYAGNEDEGEDADDNSDEQDSTDENAPIESGDMDGNDVSKHHHHHHGTHRPPRPHHGNGGKPSKDYAGNEDVGEDEEDKRIALKIRIYHSD